MSGEAMYIFWHSTKNCTVLKITGFDNRMDQIQCFTLKECTNNKDSLCFGFISTLK